MTRPPPWLCCCCARPRARPGAAAHADAARVQRERPGDGEPDSRGDRLGARIDPGHHGPGAARPRRDRPEERARAGRRRRHRARRRRRAGEPACRSSGGCASSTRSCSSWTACPGAAPSTRRSGDARPRDVDRIEVQRGPAPVMYGATSFVGVIQVVRRAPGQKGTHVWASGGSHASGSLGVGTSLPRWAGFDSSLSADFERRGFEDERSSFKKTHLLWRNRRAIGPGLFSFDLDGTFLRQEPASPTPREGRVLSDRVPIDSNQNPDGAYLERGPLLRAASATTGRSRRRAGRRRSPSPTRASSSSAAS